MSKRSQTPASLRPLRSSLSSCLEILTTREEKKLPKYDDEDNVGYSQPEFSGRRCQKEGLDSRVTGLAQQLPEDPDDQGLVKEYYVSCYRLTIMIEMRHCPH